MTSSAPRLEHVRPTVRIDDRADARVDNLVTSFRVQEGEGGMSAMEMHFEASARLTDGTTDLAFEDEKIVKLGSKISAYTGSSTEPNEIFRGVVTAVEGVFTTDGTPEFVVLAEDALQSARLARKTLVHDDVKLDALAKKLAQTLSLKPVVTGFTDSIGLQVQWNESDLSFLRRLLATRDGDLQVVGTELHVSPRADVKRGTLELNLYAELRRARITADLANQVTEITCSGWDAKQGRPVSGSSTSATAGGPGKGRTGASLLSRTLGKRSEHLRDVPVTTSDEAKAIAKAAFDQRARRFVCVDATVEGNPLLRVGTQVSLKGLSPRFDNTYYVVRACHRFDDERGYETDFEAECAFLGEP